MKLSLTDNLDPALLKRYSTEGKKAVREGIRSALKAAATPLQTKAREHVSARLKIRSKGLLKSLKAKVLSPRGDKQAALSVRFGFKAMRIHEHGGETYDPGGGYILVPLPGFTRMSKKTLTALVAAGKLAIRPQGKTLVVYQVAETGKGAMIGGRRNTKAGGGRHKAGNEVAVAILVRRSRVPKRTNLDGLVSSAVPGIGALIQQHVTARIAALPLTTTRR